MNNSIRIPMWLVTPIVVVLLVAIAVFHPRTTPSAQSSALATVTTSVPTAAPAQALVSGTSTSVPPSPTAVQPRRTPIPPTTTPVPPTSTLLPPTATPVPSTATPKPKPGEVLYQADWSKGIGGWIQAFGWKASNGLFLNDCSFSENEASKNWTEAPFNPGSVGISDYAVEAQIQRVRGADNDDFGIVVRSGYRAGINHSTTDAIPTVWTVGYDLLMAQGDYNPGSDWHTYRVEVRGNLITFLIDGAPLVRVTDNRYLSGGSVGLWSYIAQLTVRSFRVIAL